MQPVEPCPRLARFQREAQVLASLNHPGIAAIHGIEKSDDTQALVLELVEGPTLADRIAKGPIPLDEALPIAKQIAEALEAAHEAGVIHRDLKPANIKVREDGTVKVLDFGLAKALDTTPAGDPSQSPTLTAAATQQGVIMGTAAYMSPEQARGKTVDKRADIWAFGAVLFEMLTAKKPFPGDDISQTLARVIDRDPDWDALPKTLPSHLDTYLRRCLQKDSRQRVRDMGDVRLALEGAFETGDVGRLSVGQPKGSWKQSMGWAVSAVLALAAGLVLWGGIGASVDQTVTRFSLITAGQLPLASNTLMALSPDGRTVIYVAGEGGTRLYRRDLDRLVTTSLPGTEDALSPFFSPDGDGWRSRARTTRSRRCRWREDRRPLTFVARALGRIAPRVSCPVERFMCMLSRKLSAHAAEPRRYTQRG